MIYKAYLSIMFFFVVFPAYAQVTVTDVIMAFKPDSSPVHNVSVGNSADETIFVTAEPVKIERLDNGEEKRTPTQDLIVSPKRFSIKAHEQRSVRLLLRKRPEDLEEIYRISYIPQVTPHEKQDRGISIRVLTGVGMLIFAEPKKQLRKLTWDRQGEKITFTNEGNMNMHLTEFKACDPTTETTTDEDSLHCEALNISTPRLYPNRDVTLTVPAGKTIILTKDINDTAEKIVIPPM